MTCIGESVGTKNPILEAFALRLPVKGCAWGDLNRFPWVGSRIADYGALQLDESMRGVYKSCGHIMITRERKAPR